MNTKRLISCAIFFLLSTVVAGQVPMKTLIQIAKAEDERRWDPALEKLLQSTDPKTRERSALAAGRIGKEACVPALVKLLRDGSRNVQLMAAFALGEVESTTAAMALIEILKDHDFPPNVRARAVEAAGKIAAANAKDPLTSELGKALIEAVAFENEKRSAPDDEIVLLGLTAILRAHPDGGEKLVAKFLDYSNSRIRADALNTLGRLRSKTANDKARDLLQNDADPIVRANAARLVGVGEDKSAMELLLKAALKDVDSRVRVSAIRSIAALKDAGAANKLIPLESSAAAAAADVACRAGRKPDDRDRSCGDMKGTYLEIATTMGRLLANTNDQKAIEFLNNFNDFDKHQSPEINIALARIAPVVFVNQVLNSPDYLLRNNWRTTTATYQGLAEIANLPAGPENDALKSTVRVMLVQQIGSWVELPGKVKDDDDNSLTIPELMSAFAAFKSENTSSIMRPLFTHEMDVQLRATMAGILARQPLSMENVDALKKGFNAAFIIDKDSNDAQLAILDALFGLNRKEAVGSALIALNSPDYLVRQKAYKLLSTEGLEKEFPGLPSILKNFLASHKDQVLAYNPAFGTKLGQLQNSPADYLRALSRKNGDVKAILTTSKGTFTITFTPEEAPLTVDNFIKLAKLNYFNGLAVHRVVPNFVMQDGDPRGDGNGGPGWEIRCEVNMLPYDRGAVGMALSGKDTGGSQWFVTHSAQPHLDGGYTVFGKVSQEDMPVVDAIARGDKILRVMIVEGKSKRGGKNGRN